MDVRATSRYRLTNTEPALRSCFHQYTTPTTLSWQSYRAGIIGTPHLEPEESLQSESTLALNS